MCFVIRQWPKHVCAWSLLDENTGHCPSNMLYLERGKYMYIYIIFDHAAAFDHDANCCINLAMDSYCNTFTMFYSFLTL